MKSLQSNHVRVFLPRHQKMYILKWFCFIIANIYNILRYVIARILRHMCNLHIKETEISQKRSKGIINWKITYSVILSVLSNKTNLILGFSSPLNHIHQDTKSAWLIAVCKRSFNNVLDRLRREVIQCPRSFGVLSGFLFFLLPHLNFPSFHFGLL